MDINIVITEDQVKGIAKYLKERLNIPSASRDMVRRHIENIVDYTLQNKPYSDYIEIKEKQEDTYPKLF